MVVKSGSQGEFSLLGSTIYFTVISKVFIYTYANAESQTVADYENWEFVAYDQEINF